MLDEKFLLTAALITLVALIRKPVMRAITRGLDNYIETIRNNISEAKSLKAEAEALLTQFQLEKSQFEKEISESLKAANIKAEQFTKQAQAELDELLRTRTEIAMQKIANYETAVLNEIRSNSVEIAVAAIRTILTEKVQPHLTEELVDQLVTTYQKRLN